MKYLLIILILTFLGCTTPTPFELGDKTSAPYGDSIMTIKCKQEGIKDCGN